MNYLAHIYLSGKNPDVKIGNFIGDAIKGKEYKKYSTDIKKGILLHRQIDSYTDSHPIVKKSKKRLHTRYGHYAGVVIDIFYDYFLASNWSDYCESSLGTYISEFYTLINLKKEILPQEIQYIIPKMIHDNWLFTYKDKDGIAKVLQGMEQKIIHDIPLGLSREDLEEKHHYFDKDFKRFFPQLQEFSKATLTRLNTKYENL